jgi:hypothetical protein
MEIRIVIVKHMEFIFRTDACSRCDVLWKMFQAKYIYHQSIYSFEPVFLAAKIEWTEAPTDVHSYSFKPNVVLKSG